MGHSATKGKCLNCKVCKAYLRAVYENQAKTRAIFTEGEKPALSPPAEGVAAAGLTAAEKLLPEEDHHCGCPGG